MGVDGKVDKSAASGNMCEEHGPGGIITWRDFRWSSLVLGLLSWLLGVSEIIDNWRTSAFSAAELGPRIRRFFIVDMIFWRKFWRKICKN